MKKYFYNTIKSSLDDINLNFNLDTNIMILTLILISLKSYFSYFITDANILDLINI